MQIRTVEPAHGWHWLMQGLAIFRKDPARWLLLVGILFIGSRLLLAIPYVGLIVILVTPNFLAGLAHGAQALAQGKPLRLGYLASGFLKNAAHLVTLGGVSLIGHFLMLAAMTTVAGDALAEIAKTMAAGAVTPDTVAAMRTAAPRLLLSTLVGLGISLPIMLAVWFSPLLVFFDDIKPVPAMLLSLRACTRNALPLLVYCLAVLGPLFVMLQLGMALTRQPDIGVWLLAPVLVPALYASYMDVFVREPEQVA
ncbi:MAG: BPSS1780 family membrane protein [Burkholderiales bacterium]